MAAPKRKPFERQRDLETLAKMYLQGIPQAKIAEHLGLSGGQITYDLKEIQRRWQESAVASINEAKHRELHRIDVLESEYWDAWRRSQTEVTRTVQRVSEKDGNSASVAKETPIGNPAFLSGVQWCIEQRCKILGIYEATKISLDWRKAVEDQGIDAGSIFENMVNAYIEALDADTV